MPEPDPQGERERGPSRWSPFPISARSGIIPIPVTRSCDLELVRRRGDVAEAGNIFRSLAGSDLIALRGILELLRLQLRPLMVRPLREGRSGQRRNGESGKNK